MKIVTLLLSLYPPRWRERYQEEMLAVLEQHTISLATILDLLLGALDARLDPAYRTKEGFMFHRLRGTRTLSLVYVCMLATSLFSASFWIELHHSLAFVDNPTGVATDLIVVSGYFIGIAIGLLALLILSIAELIQVLKHRRFGALLFAVLCFGLSIAGVYPMLPLSTYPGIPLTSLILGWLWPGGTVLLVGAGLFMLGVKGLQAIRKRQWWTLGLALAIALFLPAGFLAYSFWGIEGGATGLRLQGSILIGNTAFSSIASFMTYLLLQIGPYLLLGGLLLALASREHGPRGWSITSGVGALLTLILALNLVAIVTWDINRWLGGGVWIFDPTHGVWPLFGGQWLGPLIANALILAFAFVLALLALLRAFLTHPEEEQEAKQLAT